MHWRIFCYLYRSTQYAGTQIASTDFKEELQTRGVHLPLAAPVDQEMKGQVEVKWRTLRTSAHSLMLYDRVLEAYINFALINKTDNIFPVLPIKDLINEYGDPTT